MNTANERLAITRTSRYPGFAVHDETTKLPFVSGSSWPGAAVTDDKRCKAVFGKRAHAAILARRRGLF